MTTTKVESEIEIWSTQTQPIALCSLWVVLLARYGHMLSADCAHVLSA